MIVFYCDICEKGTTRDVFTTSTGISICEKCDLLKIKEEKKGETKRLIQ